MSLLPFFEWLDRTDGSIELVGTTLVWPLLESFHVWTLPMFVGMTALLDLRLLGLFALWAMVAWGGRWIGFS